MQQKDIVLASQSPRRKDILREMGLEFEVCPANVDESKISCKNPSELVKKLSLAKAMTTANKISSNDDNMHLNTSNCSDKVPVSSQKPYIIIGADTVVERKGRVYGKPKSRQDAIDMIASLNGKWHKVCTGVCIVDGKTQRTSSVCSLVKFKKLTMQEIENYVDECNPLDKAGAYGIQDEQVVEKYMGSYTNIVGLPKEKLAKMLKQVGVRDGNN